MCEVNRGQGGVSNYGETDCKETDTCVCVCVCATKKVHMGMYRNTTRASTKTILHSIKKERHLDTQHVLKMALIEYLEVCMDPSLIVSLYSLQKYTTRVRTKCFT